MVGYGTSNLKGVTQDGQDMYRCTRRKFHKAAGNGIPCERPVTLKRIRVGYPFTPSKISSLGDSFGIGVKSFRVLFSALKCTRRHTDLLLSSPSERERGCTKDRKLPPSIDRCNFQHTCVSATALAEGQTPTSGLAFAKIGALSGLLQDQLKSQHSLPPSHSRLEMSSHKLRNLKAVERFCHWHFGDGEC